MLETTSVARGNADTQWSFECFNNVATFFLKQHHNSMATSKCCCFAYSFVLRLHWQGITNIKKLWHKKILKLINFSLDWRSKWKCPIWGAGNWLRARCRWTGVRLWGALFRQHHSEQCVHLPRWSAGSQEANRGERLEPNDRQLFGFFSRTCRRVCENVSWYSFIKLHIKVF